VPRAGKAWCDAAGVTCDGVQPLGPIDTHSTTMPPEELTFQVPDRRKGADQLQHSGIRPINHAICPRWEAIVQSKVAEKGVNILS
jgi:hypothetical protein